MRRAGTCPPTSSGTAELALKKDHLAYFTRRARSSGIAWSEVDVPIVFQRFELEWSL